MSAKRSSGSSPKGMKPRRIPLFDEPKTDQGRRTLALPAFAQQILREHHQHQTLERQAMEERWKDSGLVFTSTVSTPLDDRNVRTAFKALLKKADVAPMRVHDLRHRDLAIDDK